MKRKNPVFRIGNYAAPVDTAGMDDVMKNTGLGPGTPMNKVETDFVRGSKDKASATEAVRRSRKANRMPPPREY